MKTTISAFRADLGGIGGHLRPSATGLQRGFRLCAK